MNEIKQTVIKKKRGRRPKKDFVIEQPIQMQKDDENIPSIKDKIIKEIHCIDANYEIDETNSSFVISHPKIGFVQIRILLKEKFDEELIVDIATSRNLGNQKQLVVPKR